MAKTNVARIEVPAHVVRLATTADDAFIRDSWVHAAHRTYPHRYAVTEEFFLHQRARIQRILQDSVSAVAHVADDEDDLLGHMVYARWRNVLCVHFAFVKPDARRHGIFKAMLDFANWEKLPIVLTAPAVDEDTMKALTKRYLFDPELLSLMQRGGR
jgi:hypothetical protein